MLSFLGVDISSGLSWNPHIDRIVGSANRTLGFIGINIKTRMSKVREKAYITLVRPQLEYASAVLDPHTKEQASQIEKFQRRAARWTIDNFDKEVSVTRILQELGWRTLEQRCTNGRLCLFYKIVIGVGRFRILEGGQGGGGKFPEVASTLIRCHVPTRFLINQCQIITFLNLKI